VFRRRRGKTKSTMSRSKRMRENPCNIAAFTTLKPFFKLSVEAASLETEKKMLWVPAYLKKLNWYGSRETQYRRLAEKQTQCPTEFLVAASGGYHPPSTDSFLNIH
jgi:hypothetical protein